MIKSNIVKKYKAILIFVVLVGLGLLILLIRQFFLLRAAHSTFENYYAFRGCVQLIDKGADYGICKTSSGDTIKIVEIQGKWYLDGDGPGVW
jgi:hypothetical protein